MSKMSEVFKQYFISFSIIAAALLLNWLLESSFSANAIYITLYPAILLLFILVPLTPGVIASFVGLFFIEYIFAPISNAPGDVLAVVIRVVIMLGTIMLVAYVGTRFRNAMARLESLVSNVQVNELNFRNFGNQLPLMIFIRCDEHIVYVNELCAEITGYTVSQLTSSDFDFLTLIVSKDAERVMEHFLLFKEGCAIPNLEYSIVARGGKEMEVLMSLRQIDYGDRRATLGVITDISAETSIASALRESELKYRTLVQSMSEGVGVLDENNRISYMNPRALQMLGYTEKEIIGKNISSLFDVENFKIVEQHIALHLRKQRSSYQAGWQRKDGVIVQTLISGTPLFDKDDTYRGRIAVFTDLTAVLKGELALRESEERFRNLMEQVPQMIFIYNPTGNGHIVYANPYTEKILVYTLEEMTAPNFDVTTLIPKNFWSQYDAHRKKHKEGEELQNREYGILTKQGEPMTILLWTKVIRYGDETAVLGVVTDVTELNNVNEAKRGFIAALAHELRNPLGALSLSVELLRELTITMENKNKTDVIDVKSVVDITGTAMTHIKYMTHILDDLLDVARFESGKMHLKKEVVDLRDVASNAIEMIKPDLATKKIVFSASVSETPAIVYGDPVRLGQVITNLLSNAYKYTEAGGHVWVTVGHDDKASFVRVRDTGIGIRADLLPYIFKQFYQTEDAVRKSQIGLGLGLALVRTIVEMHGGTAEVHSEGVDKGAEFIVRIPSTSRVLQSLPKQSIKETPVPAETKRILVVDDNRDLASAMSKLLFLHNFDVRTCHDGASAIKEALVFKPDVVMLDIGLPDMDGYEVARTLRKREGDTTHMMLIAASGYGLPEDISKSKKAGFDAHLVKPINISELRGLIAGKGEEEKK